MDIKQDLLEKNMRVCKSCMTLKLRVLAGRFDYKNYKYQDQHGKLWNGRVCPDCHKANVRNGMRDLRSKDDKDEVKPE